MNAAEKLILGLRESFARRKPERPATPATVSVLTPSPPLMEVTPGEGPGRLQFLNVRNLGQEATFHAEAQIISSQNTNSVLAGAYPLGWGREREAWIAVPKGGTRQVLVATIREIYAGTLFHMALMQAGPSAERHWARWNAKEQLPLPRFGLRVSIIAEGAGAPWSGYFSITPENQQGTGVRITFRGLQGPVAADPASSATP